MVIYFFTKPIFQRLVSPLEYKNMSNDLRCLQCVESSLAELQVIIFHVQINYYGDMPQNLLCDDQSLISTSFGSLFSVLILRTTTS